MSTCKDCLNYEMCSGNDMQKINYSSWELANNIESGCEYFKDNSKFIELPCRIGDYIKWRNEWGDIVFLEVTGFDFDEKGNAVKYHTKYSDIQPYVDETEIVPKERLSQERGKLND